MSETKWTPGLAGQELDRMLRGKQKFAGDTFKSLAIPVSLAEQLIAESSPAAPEMAEELDWWLANGENIAVHPECYKPGEIHARVIKARKVLAKAEGRS